MILILIILILIIDHDGWSISHHMMIMDDDYADWLVIIVIDWFW